jgi:hypothetical protein
MAERNQPTAPPAGAPAPVERTTPRQMPGTERYPPQQPARFVPQFPNFNKNPHDPPGTTSRP